MTAAGRAIRRFVKNLYFIATPCVFVAAIVVSEIKDRLSPNMAPPTTVPMQSGRKRPAFAETCAAIGTSTEIVPTEVPIAIEIRQAMTKRPGTASLSGIIVRSRFAVLAAPPA